MLFARRRQEYMESLEKKKAALKAKPLGSKPEAPKVKEEKKPKEEKKKEA